MKTSVATRIRRHPRVWSIVLAALPVLIAQAQHKPPRIVSDYIDTGGKRGFVCGGHDSYNSLIITNAGSINSYTAFIGQKGGANHNRVLVTGPKAAWYSTCGFDIGDYSSDNSLTIVDGGKVSCMDAYLGWSGGAHRNSATVIGKGSILNVASKLYVGNGGSHNTLTVKDGGAVYSSDGAIVGGGGSGNIAALTGSDTMWDVGSGTMLIGTGKPTHSNRVSVADGASVRGRIVVHNGATLAGAGSVGHVTLKPNAMLSPGTPIGQLRVTADLVLHSKAKLLFDLESDKEPGKTYDQVLVTGTVELNGLDFNSFDFTAAKGFGAGVYTLFKADAVEGELGEKLEGDVTGRKTTLSVNKKKQAILLTVK